MGDRDADAAELGCIWAGSLAGEFQGELPGDGGSGLGHDLIAISFIFLGRGEVKAGKVERQLYAFGMSVVGFASCHEKNL